MGEGEGGGGFWLEVRELGCFDPSGFLSCFGFELLLQDNLDIFFPPQPVFVLDLSSDVPGLRYP